MGKEGSLALAACLALGWELPGGDDGGRARAVVVSQSGCINKHKALTRDSSYNPHLCLYTHRRLCILLLQQAATSTNIAIPCCVSLPRRDLIPPSLPLHPAWTSCFEEATPWTWTSITSPPSTPFLLTRLQYCPCIFTRHSSFRFVRLPVSSIPRTSRLFFFGFTYTNSLQPCRIILLWL